MVRAHLIGTGSSTPKKILKNPDLERIVDTSDEWITRRTGIKERRISSNKEAESTTELATQASLKALEMAKVSPENLDMIVVGTVTPDRQFPSAACMVQKELNAQYAAAFDISAGCSGFIYALSIVDNAIRTGMCQNALVIGAERLSSVANWRDRGTCVLLGDGAGAVIVTAAEDQGGILSTHLKSDGTFWDLLYSSYGDPYTPETLQDLDQKPFYLKMEGNKLFKRAIAFMAAAVREALQHNSLTNKDIGLVIPHQANMRIIHGLANSLDIPIERVYTNVHKYGNTSSASIPIAMDEAKRKGLINKGDHTLLVAFGAGLTWASSIIKWAL